MTRNMKKNSTTQTHTLEIPVFQSVSTADPAVQIKMKFSSLQSILKVFYCIFQYSAIIKDLYMARKTRDSQNSATRLSITSQKRSGDKKRNHL